MEGVQAPQFVGVEDFPCETGGTFEVPLAEVVQAQLAALEREGWSVSVGPFGDGGKVMTARKEGHEATLTFVQPADGGSAGTVALRVEEL